MKKLLMGIVLLLLTTLAIAKDIDINKAKGISQDVIVSLTPIPAQMGVSQDVTIKARFNIDLDAQHVKKNDIKLKYITQTQESIIDGNVGYIAEEKAVTFKSKQELEKGYYEIEFKSLKPVKKEKDKQIKEIKYRFVVDEEALDTIAPNIILNGESTVTLFQDSNYEELGAKATDESDGDVDVTVSGSVDTSIEGTYTITYTATDKAGNEATATRTVNVVALTLTGISLESNVTLLNVGDKATLTIIGTYSDNSTKVLTSNIEWIVSPADSAQMNGSILTAKKDAQVSVQAKLGTVFSNTVNLTIATIINGYVLPPEPDPAVNNATLLGVDANDNGVRDDVERFIVIKYKDQHKIVTEIGFQGARAYQMIVENPLNTEENHKALHDAMDCNHYYKFTAKYANNGDSVLIDHYIDSGYKNLQLNTKARVKAYLEYDKQLSGGVYNATPLGEDEKRNCNFDVNALLGGE